jgi:hypothetical protein
MLPITSYLDAADELRAFIEEAALQGAPDEPINWFMARWEGKDAQELCGVNYPIYELVGFLEGYGMDNTYVTSDVAERLNKEFGIEFLKHE